MGPLNPLPTMPGAAPGALRPAPAQSLPPPDFGGFPAPGAGSQETAYEAVSQQDGTVLLYLKLPDGTLGPAVKIVSVPKGKGAAGPGMPFPMGPVPGR